MRGPAPLVLLAVLLLQVPWLPCHCGAECSAVPALGAVALAESGGSAHRCPAHGSSHASGGAARRARGGPGLDPDGGGGDRHDHAVPTVSALRADPLVRLDVAPVAPAAFHEASRLLPLASPEGSVPFDAPSGPPARLSTVRLRL